MTPIRTPVAVCCCEGGVWCCHVLRHGGSNPRAFGLCVCSHTQMVPSSVLHGANAAGGAGPSGLGGGGGGGGGGAAGAAGGGGGGVPMAAWEQALVNDAAALAGGGGGGKEKAGNAEINPVAVRRCGVGAQGWTRPGLGPAESPHAHPMNLSSSSSSSSSNSSSLRPLGTLRPRPFPLIPINLGRLSWTCTIAALDLNSARITPATPSPRRLGLPS